MPEFRIGDRWIGDGHPPLAVAEAGINHAGSMVRAVHLVDEARAAGAELVKFQCHIPHAEMTEFHPWARTICEAELGESQERALKAHVERCGMMFMSTPFSIEAVDRLAALGVPAFKIGSGECSNIPLIERAASYGLPIILSTGMHDTREIAQAVEVLRDANAQFALMHCTSEYPTQYGNVRLGGLRKLRDLFPDAVIGLSDHSLGIYTALAAVALGASIIEKHFTTAIPEGPDAEVSISPHELGELVAGARAVHAAMGGTAEALPCENAVARLAKHVAVSKRDIAEGSELSADCVTLRRADGGLPLSAVLGRKARRYIRYGMRIDEDDIA